ncbi:MAG: IS200/IS605 family transposase [Bacteroidaceae bacterium]|nr:IS200/IS605 family transposase [Bacteroidaceae bacterium]
MAQSLCKIYLHIIFHTKTTSPLIPEEHLPRLHQYIAKIVETTGCNVITLGGTGNHVHALVTLNSTENVAHLVEEMKRNSSRWIKTLSPSYGGFAWQGGYAALSVSQSQVDVVVRYIGNQEEHHRKQTYREEYLQFLRLYNIDYDERYVLAD